MFILLDRLPFVCENVPLNTSGSNFAIADIHYYFFPKDKLYTIPWFQIKLRKVLWTICVLKRRTITALDRRAIKYANVPKLTDRAVSKLNPPQRHLGVMGDNEKSMLQHQIFISTQPLMTNTVFDSFCHEQFLKHSYLPHNRKRRMGDERIVVTKKYCFFFSVLFVTGLWWTDGIHQRFSTMSSYYE